MSRTRGYTTYRGRGSFPFWKGVLAVVLLSVILASGGLVILQQRLSMDGQGNVRLDDADGQRNTPPENLPQIITGTPEDETPGGEASGAETEAEEEPAQPPGPVSGWPELRAYRVHAAPLNTAIYWDIDKIAADGGYDAVSVTLKDEDGIVYFDAPSGLPGSRRYSDGTAEALHLLTESSRYSIARLACFHDPYAANANVERYGLRNTGGYIFYDLFEGDARSNWMDPSKPAARDYLCNLAADIAELGFDEILLTTVGYPPVGQLDKIDYGDEPIADHLTTFFREMRSALSPYGVKLSVEVSRDTAFGGGDPSGLTLEMAAKYADRVYASVEPGAAASEIAAGTERLAALEGGNTPFIPELWAMPDPAPKRFLLASS